MTTIVDAHVHLDLYPDPYQVVRECRQEGVYALCMTTTPKAWDGTSILVGDAPRIRCAIGLHPQLAFERKEELPLLLRLMWETPYVGELGLDGAMPVETHATQRLVLTKALERADELGGRVVSLHSRRAAGAVLEVIEQHADRNLLILHWFSGTASQLRDAAAMGCWFSVGPAMLHSKKGRALVGAMPRDRVLTETDGPFAKVKGRPLHPRDARRACSSIAAAWDMSDAEVAQLVVSNFRRLGEYAVDRRTEGGS